MYAWPGAGSFVWSQMLFPFLCIPFYPPVPNTTPQTKRDGMDYKSMSGVTHVLNNTESVLPKDDVKDAIDGYEELFAGARKEVSLHDQYRHRGICSDSGTAGSKFQAYLGHHESGTVVQWSLQLQ